jgi:hypothetical protein
MVPVMQKKIVKYKHIKNPEMRRFLRRSQFCPTCRVQRHVELIDILQTEVERRGGIFDSKIEVPDHWISMPPDRLRHQWSFLKVLCIGDIENYESSRDQYLVKTVMWGVLQAL